MYAFVGIIIGLLMTVGGWFAGEQGHKHGQQKILLHFFTTF